MTASPSTHRPSRRPVLEPLRPVLIGVSLAHLGLAALIAWLALSPSVSSPSHTGSAASARSPHSGLLWFHPADFQSLPPPPSPPPANAPPQALPPPSPPVTPSTTPNRSAAARYITLSRVNNVLTPPHPKPDPASPAANVIPDAAVLAQLDRIDEALYEAFMQVWSPPRPEGLGPDKRVARLDITLKPDITLEQADLVVPSGSSDLDLSVLVAAEKVAERLQNRFSQPDRLKFPPSLPSSFQNSRYVCRIQFQIE